MSRLLSIVLFGLLGLAVSERSPAEEPRVSAADFAALEGTRWSGVLRYLDYGSATQRQIPVEIIFDKPRRRKVVYRIKYPGEEQYNTTESLKWSGDGRKLNGKPLSRRDENPDGRLVLQSDYRGEDDERPADIRMTYDLDSTAIIISKQVRFADSEAFVERNAYVLDRVR